MTEVQPQGATELLFCLGILLTAAAVVVCKLKWGDHIKREERKYRAARRFGAVWAYVLTAAAFVLLLLGVLGVIAGDARGLGMLAGCRVICRRQPVWFLGRQATETQMARNRPRQEASGEASI